MIVKQRFTNVRDHIGEVRAKMLFVSRLRELADKIERTPHFCMVEGEYEEFGPTVYLEVLASHPWGG